MHITPFPTLAKVAFTIIIVVVVVLIIIHFFVPLI